MQQRQIMPGRAARLVTAKEFARIPDDDYHYELVEGHVVRMSPPGSRHRVSPPGSARCCISTRTPTASASS